MTAKLLPLYLFNKEDDPKQLVQNVTYDPEEEAEIKLGACHLREIVDDCWADRDRAKITGSAELGWLISTKEGLHYGKGEYKQFYGINVFKERLKKGDMSYMEMFIRTQFSESSAEIIPRSVAKDQLYHALPLFSAMSCVVVTADNQVIVQQRGSGIIAEYMLDVSAAGMCTVADGKLDFYGAMKKRLERELKLTPEQIEKTLQPTGTHGAIDYFSNQVTWRCSIDMPFEEVKAKANDKYVERILPVRYDDLPDFLLDHYVKKAGIKGEGLIADACASFLRVLPEDAREEAIKKMNGKGAMIDYAIMHKGEVFVVKYGNEQIVG